MAKRRNSPALFELLRDQSGHASGVGARTEPGQARPAASLSRPAPAATAAAPVAVAPAAAPAAPAEPAREPKPLSDRPSMDIETPRFVAEPVRVRPGEPEMPDLSGLEPEPAVARTDDGRVSFSLSVSALAGVIGAAVVALVVFGATLYSLGGAASKEQLKPIIGAQANEALEGAERATPREPVAPPPVREPSSDPTREAVPEADLTLTPENPARQPVVEGVPAEPEQAAAAEADAEPDQPSNVDTRKPGLNYMYTSMTFDRDEAVRAQQFLFDNGIDSIIEEMTRQSDGRKAYRLWTLVGIPGEGFSTSREKFNHQRAMFDLGNEWLTEHDGRLDFSRESQIGWIKYGG